MPTVDVYISGRDYILKADLTGGTTYLPVAALTTNEFSSKNPSIDATSKEGNLHQYSPYYDQSFKCEGFAITQTGTVSKDSYAALYAAHIAKTVINVEMVKATPVTGDISYVGLVVITDWDVKAADKDDAKFSCTMRVAVPPIAQVTAP